MAVRIFLNLEFKQNIELKKLGNIVTFEGIGGDEILGGYNSHLYLLIRYLSSIYYIFGIGVIKKKKRQNPYPNVLCKK